MFRSLARPDCLHKGTTIAWWRKLSDYPLVICDCGAILDAPIAMRLEAGLAPRNVVPFRAREVRA